MADASRFPQLALPFALIGASAGWLSVRMLSNPLLDLVRHGDPILASACAATFAAVTGALLTRFCVGRRYAYEIGAPDPDLRPAIDVWPLHTAVVLTAAASAGAVYLVLVNGYGGPLLGAVGGVGCAMLFLPVCFTVLAFARRAQRARLGSLVAGSDRRAVWGVLALALAVCTAEVLADWPASADVAPPAPALGMVLAAFVVTAGILAFDRRALRDARRALAPGFERSSAGDPCADDDAAARLDLGLGDEVLSRLARSASAYRGRDRTTAQIKGSPERTLDALHRAVRRGVFGLVGVAVMGGAHLLATGDLARRAFETQQCDTYRPASCVFAGARVRRDDPTLAIRFFRRACDSYRGDGCLALGEMYESGEGVLPDRELAIAAYRRACEERYAGSCRRAADLIALRGGGAALAIQEQELRARACALGDSASCAPTEAGKMP